MPFYRIRDKKTKLYSTGGIQPKWNENGKMFASLGIVRSHFSNWMRALYHGNGYYPYPKRPAIPQEEFLAQYEVIPYLLKEYSQGIADANNLQHTEREVKKLK